MSGPYKHSERQAPYRRRTSADERFYAAQQDGARVVRVRPLNPGKPRSLGTRDALGDEANGHACDVCHAMIVKGQEALVSEYSDGTRHYCHADCPLRVLLGAEQS